MFREKNLGPRAHPDSSTHHDAVDESPELRLVDPRLPRWAWRDVPNVLQAALPRAAVPERVQVAAAVAAHGDGGRELHAVTAVVPAVRGWELAPYVRGGVTRLMDVARA